MARIVPAKPKIKDERFLEYFLEIEKQLADDFVVFQNYPADDCLLIANENTTPIVLIPIIGAVSIDFDEFSIMADSGVIDIDEIIKKTMNVVSDIFEQSIVIFYLPELDETINGIEQSGKRPEIIFLTKNKNLIANLQVILENNNNHRVNVENINTLISIVTPNSTLYEKGKISPAQEKWRQEKDGQKLYSSSIVGNTLTSQNESSEGNQSNNIIIDKPLTIKKSYEKASVRIDYLEKMVENCISNIARGRPIFSSGVEVEPNFVADRESLLPALIIAASEYWAPVVVKSEGKGGFDIRLKSDPESLLGMKVEDVLPSAPMVLFMPIAHLFRTKLSDNEFILDDIVGVFGRWVFKNGLENTELEEIDLKIALKTIEGN